jgi:hypothetical protein
MAVNFTVRALADLNAPTKDALDVLETEWNPDSPPDTVATAKVARAFDSALATIPAPEIEAVVRFAEMLMTTGDETMSTVIATGFFEALLAQASGGLSIFAALRRC